MISPKPDRESNRNPTNPQSSEPTDKQGLVYHNPNFYTKKPVKEDEEENAASLNKLNNLYADLLGNLETTAGSDDELGVAKEIEKNRKIVEAKESIGHYPYPMPVGPDGRPMPVGPDGRPVYYGLPPPMDGQYPVPPYPGYPYPYPNFYPPPGYPMRPPEGFPYPSLPPSIKDLKSERTDDTQTEKKGSRDKRTDKDKIHDNDRQYDKDKKKSTANDLRSKVNSREKSNDMAFILDDNEDHRLIFNTHTPSFDLALDRECESKIKRRETSGKRRRSPKRDYSPGRFRRSRSRDKLFKHESRYRKRSISRERYPTRKYERKSRSPRRLDASKSRLQRKRSRTPIFTSSSRRLSRSPSRIKRKSRSPRRLSPRSLRPSVSSLRRSISPKSHRDTRSRRRSLSPVKRSCSPGYRNSQIREKDNMPKIERTICLEDHKKIQEQQLEIIERERKKLAKLTKKNLLGGDLFGILNGSKHKKEKKKKKKQDDYEKVLSSLTKSLENTTEPDNNIKQECINIEDDSHSEKAAKISNVTKPKPVDLTLSSTNSEMTIEDMRKVLWEDYDKNTNYAKSFVVPVSGFFCRLCQKFYQNPQSAYERHTKSEIHFKNAKKFLSITNDQINQFQAAKQVQNNKVKTEIDG